MLALIDADIVAYRCAAVTKEEHESVALIQVEEMIKRILETTKADSYISYITGPNNFRYKVNPEYKANRKDVEKPPHLQACKDFIVKHWNGFVTDGYEADDGMGMAQTKETVICSIDKDMLMIPGLHFNFVGKKDPSGVYVPFFTEIDQLEGIKQLYRQMIIGDPTDNIFGVKGIGKVGAAKEIDHLETEQEMIETVALLYGLDLERFIMNADCLWIWRNMNEKYSDRKDVPWLEMMLQETKLKVKSPVKNIVGASTAYSEKLK